MNISAPIYRLKREAKLLSRKVCIPLHEALDRVAQGEGFTSWSLLAAKHASESPSRKIYDQLRPGDMILIGARPGQGKTLLSLEIAVEAMKEGHQAYFFTLEYTEKDCRERFESLDIRMDEFRDKFVFDGSDLNCADYIVNRLSEAKPGTLVVVDYLQVLDQRRESPPLNHQIEALRSFATSRNIRFVFISQVVRTFDPKVHSLPQESDIRLPNPVNLDHFNMKYMLHDGKGVLIQD